ncbi:hypothetical protein INR49_027997 [Caranx melampygus]|nr:hypothetical protein INR49_027997 [Caranx melampygus]
MIVEIPSHTVLSGNGTVITVMTKEDRGDDTDHDASPGSSWMDVLVFFLRCLPLLVLLITLFYINNRLNKAQQHKAAAPENTSPSAKRGEEDHEEEEREEDGETPL